MSHIHLLGVILGMIMYVISVSPSLLPRRWWWHGVVSGSMVAAGYATGWLLTNIGGVILNATQVKLTYAPELGRWVPVIFWIIFGAWCLRSIFRFYQSSQQAAELVQMKPVRVGEYLLGLLMAAFIFVAVIAAAMLLARLDVLLVHWLAQWTGEPLAWLISAGAVFYSVLLLANRVVFRVIMAYFSREAARRNDRTASGVHQPTVPERSGSEQSLVTWQSVGAQGRTFLGRGPSRAQIESVTGTPAQEPIRVYVGLQGQDFAEQAQVVIAEMRRTGAFDRKVILISVATGSGWVDEWIVQPMEYLTQGDCATVSMQYSYLFSAAIFVGSQDVCRDASDALFQAVKAELDGMTNPPLLIISGESLGADAAQHSFADLDDMIAKVDGAILVGAPCQSPVLSEVIDGRHRGSPEVAPVFGSGRQVRVVNNPEQLDQDIYGRRYGAWDFPRLVFAQHASDPVVWYNTELAFREPDWLVERAGLDVSPNMRFTQIVTYLQIIGDLPMAGTAPGGHGHTYCEELIPVWVKILGIGEDVPSRYPRGPETVDVTALGHVIRADIEGSGRR